MSSEKKRPFKLADLLRKSKKTVDKIARDVSSEIQKGMDSTNSAKLGKNLKKLGKQIEAGIQDTQSNFKRFMTSRGKSIKINLAILAAMATGGLMGMTVRDAFVQSHQQDPVVIREYQDREIIISDYITILKEHPEKMDREHWVALIANISANLEAHLRFRLNIEKEEKMNLFQILERAKEDEIFTGEELDRLHEFRKLRNMVLHHVEEEDLEPELVLWVSDLVDEMDEETIVG
jgi:hypothetical protein